MLHMLKKVSSMLMIGLSCSALSPEPERGKDQNFPPDRVCTLRTDNYIFCTFRPGQINFTVGKVHNLDLQKKTFADLSTHTIW